MASAERVPRSLFDGLLATRRATWTPAAIRAWWACLVASHDPAVVEFLAHSRHLDEVVYGLKEDLR